MKVHNISGCLSRWYFLTHRIFCYQIWYGYTTLWASHAVILLLLLLSSTSRSQRGLIWSKYDSFYYTVWTVDSLGKKKKIKKLRVSRRKTNGLLHWSRSQWRVKMLIFVQVISSKPPNILFPNLVLWCIIMSQSVMKKDWFSIFEGKVTARAHVIKLWQFLLYPLNCWSICYQTWFDSTLSKARVFYGEIGLLCSRSRSQQIFQMSVNVCPDDIFWIAEPLTTKLDMVMHL